MPTPNLIVRTPADLRELAEARAKRDGCNVSDVARSALRAYLTRDDGEELHAALARAGEAEAKVTRLEESLAAARKRHRTAVAAALPAARNQHRAAEAVLAQQARVAARDAKDDRFAAALGAATAEDPVTARRLAAVSGFTADWCKHLLRGLGDAGYAQRTEPVTRGVQAYWVPVPGRDIREGIGTVKALAERPQARIGPRYRSGGDLARPDTSVKFREPK